MKLIKIKHIVINKDIKSNDGFINNFCFGCNTNTENKDKFIQIKSKNDCYTPYCICMNCKNDNESRNCINCIKCDKTLRIDFTELKENDIICGGKYAFLCCDNCLQKYDDDNMCIQNGCFDFTSNGYFDTWYEEYEGENITEIRRLGYMNENNYDKIKKNIQKKISNCKFKDKKKFNISGNINYHDVLQLLNVQSNKCYICNDKLLISKYEPNCLYQFSLDRLDNTKPHDKNNISISCYFCNCKDHYLFNISKKECCDNNH